MLSAFFLESTAGRIFCTATVADARTVPHRHIVIVPPFAEEMNKSRHVLAQLAARLAGAGHAVLTPDLFGTGDSEGDFGQATIDIWRADLDAAIAHLAAPDRVDLIGLRSGALLAVDAAHRHRVGRLVLLHPVAEGKQQMVQMLRLRIAGGITGGDRRESTADLQSRLADGETLEIAGYRLSGALAAGLTSLALAEMPPTAADRIDWIELAPEVGRPPLPASQRVIDAWAAAGIAVDTASVVCDPFWATQEICQCPAIVERALRHLCE